MGVSWCREGLDQDHQTNPRRLTALDSSTSAGESTGRIFHSDGVVENRAGRWPGEPTLSPRKSSYPSHLVFASPRNRLSHLPFERTRRDVSPELLMCFAVFLTKDRQSDQNHCSSPTRTTARGTPLIGYYRGGRTARSGKARGIAFPTIFFEGVWLSDPTTRRGDFFDGGVSTGLGTRCSFRATAYAPNCSGPCARLSQGRPTNLLVSRRIEERWWSPAR